MTLVRAISCFLVFTLMAASGCGYSLQHRAKKIFLDPRGIFIPVFENRTHEVGAERIFTNALIRELASRRQIILSSRKEGALELRGVITSIDISETVLTPLGFKGLQGYQRLPSELGVRVHMHLSLIDQKNKKVLWEQGFSGFRRVEPPVNRTFDYESPSSTGIITQSIWEGQYPQIARMMMRDVYDAMVEVL